MWKLGTPKKLRTLPKKAIEKIALLKKPTKIGLILLITLVFTATFFFFIEPKSASAEIFLTSGTSWTVPAGWNNANNSIEVIGGGGGGGGGFADSSGSGGGGAGGGGAGAYSKAINITLEPGSTVGISIGSGGAGGASSANGTSGTDTYLCSNTANCTSITDSAVVVGAIAGLLGNTGTNTGGGSGGAGGLSTSGIGTTRVNGGTGGTPSGPISGAGSGGGGGGGAGGLNTNGNNGTTNTGITQGSGGQGNGTFGGAGGTGNSGAGGNGTEYSASFGSGGGGAGGRGIAAGSGSPGGISGTYGAAGGGGGGNGNKSGSGGAGGAGNQGLIRIVYNFTIQSSYRWRLDDGSVTSGTSLAAQDTPATVNSNVPVRLRFGISNQGDITTYDYRIEYAPYDLACGSWTVIPNTPTTEHFNMVTTANYSDQAASTNVGTGSGVLTDPPGYTFAAGKVVSSPSNTALGITLNSSQYTELEYAFQVNTNATSPAYCFRLTNAGTLLEQYSVYPILNINFVPSVPTIFSVADGSTNNSRLPFFQLKSTDVNKDYLQYVVEVCATNSWPCASSPRIYNQTASQTCWSSQNAQTSTAFQSDGLLSSSTMAYCQLPLSDILDSSTSYFMRARVTDPGGTAAYSAYSNIITFTTGSLDIQVTGGTNITGGTIIGN